MRFLPNLYYLLLVDWEFFAKTREMFDRPGKICRSVFIVAMWRAIHDRDSYASQIHYSYFSDFVNTPFPKKGSGSYCLLPSAFWLLSPAFFSVSSSLVLEILHRKTRGKPLTTDLGRNAAAATVALSDL